MSAKKKNAVPMGRLQKLARDGKLENIRLTKSVTGSWKRTSEELARVVTSDTLEHWKVYGYKALQRVYEMDPEAYLVFITRLLPKLQDNEPDQKGNLIIMWDDGTDASNVKTLPPVDSAKARKVKRVRDPEEEDCILPDDGWIDPVLENPEVFERSLESPSRNQPD